MPTAPFREEAVTAKALEWIREQLGPKAAVRRRRGGVVVSYRGAGDGEPALALAAHLDHPAFAIVSSNARQARALLRGGLPPHLLTGAKVEAFPRRPKDNRPLATGTVGPRPKKDGAPWTIRWDAPPKARPDFAVLKLVPCEVKDGWLNSRSVDDLLGCAAGLEAMRRLIRAKAKVNLTVLLNRAEEVGFVGALDMILSRELPAGDSYISIESSRELPGSRPGKGPTIRLGDRVSIFDGNLTALLDEAADALRRRGRKVQRLRLTGGACEGTAYLAFGYEAGGVAVPLVNYHNGWGAKAVAPERVRVSDFEGCVALLVEAAKRFQKKTLRGALRARLKARHAGEARNLAQ